MKPKVIYHQGKTNLCQTYVCFWILGINTGKWFPQNLVIEFAKKKNIKEGDFNKKGGASSKDVAKMIANELKMTYKEFFWMDEDFMRELNLWHAIGLSMRADTTFWRDTLDGDIDSYFHKRGQSNHAVYIYKDEDVWLVNSFGSAIPPCKVDLEKFKPEWLVLTICFTFVK